MLHSNEEADADTPSVGDAYSDEDFPVLTSEEAMNLFIAHLHSSHVPLEYLRLTGNAMVQWGQAFRRKTKVGWSVFGVYPKQILCRTNEIAGWLRETRGRMFVEQRFLQPINEMNEILSEAYDALFSPGSKALPAGDIWKYTSAAGRAAIKCGYTLGALHVELSSPLEVEALGEQVESIGDAESINAAQPPALTSPDQLVLHALAMFDPSVLAVIPKVVEAISAQERLSERTVGDSIRKLIDLGLAERPEGDKRGARLTMGGRRLATKLAG